MGERPEERFVGHGLGKLILCGEHAVVHGHPAIAMALDRGTAVTLFPIDGPSRPPAGADARLRRALDTVLPATGLAVSIDSALPVGRGLGSSAALSVATARALGAWEGAPSEAIVLERASAMERVFHGKPSGIDHTIAARGGIVHFRRTEDGPELQALPEPGWSLVVLDSGTAGDTAALVAGVTANRPAIDPVLARIGALVQEARAALDDPVALGPMLTENHRLLQRLGVSVPALDRLVALALDAGAHGAKLAGAGGGGVVLALVEDPAPVLHAARAQGVEAFACRPGGAR